MLYTGFYCCIEKWLEDVKMVNWLFFEPQFTKKLALEI